MIPGIDVSEHNGRIDWERVFGTGVRFAIIRSSYGITKVDKRWRDNWGPARAAGLRRGPYHFLVGGVSALVQADAMLSQLGDDYDDRDLPPMVDVEELSFGAGVTAAQVADAAIEVRVRLEKEFGRAPMLYTNANTMAMLGAHADRMAAGFPTLYVAHVDTQRPLLPRQYGAWAFWQYSWTGKLDGIKTDVDMCWFNGDEEGLESLVEMSKVLASP